jgi:hypothetical protein
LIFHLIHLLIDVWALKWLGMIDGVFYSRQSVHKGRWHRHDRARYQHGSKCGSETLWHKIRRHSQRNPAGRFIAKWAVEAGTVEVTTLEMTVLAGGVAGVGEAWL